MKLKYLTGLLLLFLITWTGCRDTITPQADMLRIGMRRGPGNFNPYLYNDSSGDIFAARLFPTLFYELPQMIDGLPGLEPYLVESFTRQEAQVMLELKRGLTWSDGVALTAEDVAFSLEARHHPEVAWISADPSHLLSWEVIDAHHISVQFAAQAPLNLLRLNEGFIIPKHHFSKVPFTAWREFDWSKNLVSFGPYQLGVFEAGERLILEPRDHRLPRLGLAFVRDRETLYKLLKKGELDYAFDLPRERMTTLAEPLVPLSFPNLVFTYLAWNPYSSDAFQPEFPGDVAALKQAGAQAPHPLFSDVRVRRALALGLNRQAYLTRFWGAYGSLPVSPWHAGLPYQEPTHQARSFDPEQAAALLDEAGWVMQDGLRSKAGIPFRFTLLALAGNRDRENELLAIQADLANLGVMMDIELAEAGLYVERCSRRNFDAVMGAFRTGTRPDLTSLFHSKAALRDGYNYSSWFSADVFLEEVSAAQDLSTLQRGLAGLESLFYDEQPLTLLHAGSTLGARQKSSPQPKSNYLDPLYRIETWK